MSLRSITRPLPSLRPLSAATAAPEHAVSTAVSPSHGTPPDFDAVYADYVDTVWRNLARMGLRPPTLEDALQEVFLVVHRRLCQFEQRSTLKTWIFGITLRVASEHLRRSKRLAERHSELTPDLPDHAGKDPAQLAAERQAVQWLHAALAELDEQKRAVFILSEIEEMSATEIAEVIGVNANTVASRLKAARRRFTAVLQRYRAHERWRRP